MDMLNVIITWISWALAAYMVGVTILIVASMAIGAIKARSALWWYLVFSVVVVGMMLAGLQYLPTMVLQSANDGIEAAQPEMARFAENVQGIFNSAVASDSMPAPANTQQTAVDPLPAAPPTVDTQAGGGAPQFQAPLPPTMAPVLSTPTIEATVQAAATTLLEPDYQATSTSQVATVQAVGVTPTFDVLNPPTPVIQKGQ